MLKTSLKYKATNNQSKLKVSILPEGFESHFKTKLDAFGSHASNSSECRSIPKKIRMVEGPRVITGVKRTPNPIEQMDFSSLFFNYPDSNNR